MQLNQTLLSLAFLVCTAVSSCAVSSDSMVPANLSLGNGRPDKVTVVVTGGDDVSFFKDGLDPNEFRAGLVKAIRKYNLFGDVVDGQGAFTLEVDLVHTTLPSGPLAREAKLLARWTLRKASVEQPVFEDFIESKAAGSGFAGGTRTITALEGAARENIAEAFRRLAAVH